MSVIQTIELEGKEVYPDIPPCYESTTPSKAGHQYQMPTNPQLVVNDPTAQVVQMCQAPIVVEQPLPNAGSEHMFESIFSCIFCVWPIGFVAVIVSFMSCQAYENGDMERGKLLGRVALILAYISFGLGFSAVSIFLLIRFGI